jgi:glutamyl-tRNA reductase
MQIAVVGLNHHQAPIKIREQASFTESKKIKVMSALIDLGFEEVVILSTCNRCEI